MVLYNSFRISCPAASLRIFFYYGETWQNVVPSQPDKETVEYQIRVEGVVPDTELFCQASTINARPPTGMSSWVFYSLLVNCAYNDMEMYSSCSLNKHSQVQYKRKSTSPLN